MVASGAWTFGGEDIPAQYGGDGVVRPVMDAGEFARIRLGIEPDARQMEVLLSNSKRGILNCSRQCYAALI